MRARFAVGQAALLANDFYESAPHPPSYPTLLHSRHPVFSARPNSNSQTKRDESEDVYVPTNSRGRIDGTPTLPSIRDSELDPTSEDDSPDDSA